ncbi:MAG: acetyl/propionyl-CoA carboxylase subunit alpha [Hyphomicrobiales bacterium]|nr:MAG: acetyl/propionyl-CoA carboxylase subunit alpha [Hyphomicrobiales bacterium]
MFRKILIANRGEIACRVIRTAKDMGIATVAVYSEADAQALHVKMADEAVLIGPAPAAQSYLIIDNIMRAIRDTGAEAVHPGYGFLSENAEFARRLAAENIAFIGPPVRAIEVMGDKIASKKFAEKAGVNVIPGFTGEVESADQAVRIAGEVGYPVMIKASAGGGGKGMRVARDPSEVAQGFESSQNEARSSFGDDRIFIERYIENPRHIEIQVLADGHGNVIHLNERECSIQRRNQKVVEEAPSAFVGEEMRATMGAQAVALAKAVGYQSAGTVEFIADTDHNFFFLEMNTRLQVEHPVTELITGVDLVEQMIRAAAGEPLSLTQDDIGIEGWAIESRLYAEDPYRGFLPSTGRLSYYRPPAEGSTAGVSVRNDTGVFEGGEISIHYDPMIAKLCTHAPTRDAATEAMSVALDRFMIEGIGHNIPFLSALMGHQRWQSADLSTNFIAEEYPDGFDHRAPDEGERLIFAVMAAIMDRIDNDRRRTIGDQMRMHGFEFGKTRIVRVGEHEVTLEIAVGEPGRYLISLPGSERQIEVLSAWQPGMRVWEGEIDGHFAAAQIVNVLNGYVLSRQGTSSEVHVFTPNEAELAAFMPVKLAPDTSKMLLCPMPGLMLSLSVAEGEEVKAGQVLCVVEAMKMENVLKAEKDGTVKAINAAPGDNLAVDDVLIEFV